MKWLVCGGRKFADKEFLESQLDKMAAAAPCEKLVHGNAPGADTLARLWAETRCIPAQGYPAAWGRWKNVAGPIRNRDMMIIERPTIVIAFPGWQGP